MMRLLITGGAGCLGSNIAEHALAQGAAVLVLDNYATSFRSGLPPHPNLREVEGSILDDSLLARLFDEFAPTHVVHAAASYQDPNDWVSDLRTNAEGTARVMAKCDRSGVRRLVYLQTALCYGKPRQTPIPVDHPLTPITSYSISKTAGEQMLPLGRTPWVSLRLANIYGPRNYTGPIPIFFKRLREGKRCFATDARRDFLHMDDFLDLLDRVLDESGAQGVFNVSSGTDVSIADLFNAMVAAMGITLDEPVEVRPPAADDLATLLLDPALTERTFGWRARIGLDEGLQRQVAWFDRHGVEATFTHLTAARG